MSQTPYQNTRPEVDAKHMQQTEKLAPSDPKEGHQIDKISSNLRQSHQLREKNTKFGTANDQNLSLGSDMRKHSWALVQ